MPEASIVIKSTDRYSDAVKSMAKTTRAFTKDVDSLEEGLYALNKNKYTLKLDVKKAQQALKEAEKQFEKTGDAADGLKMELAQANYDNAVRNLNVVAKAARDTEKEISKLENRSGSGGGGGAANFGKSIVQALAITESAIVQSNSFLKEPQRLRGALSEVKAGCLFQMHFLWPHPEPLPVLWLRVRSVL